MMPANTALSEVTLSPAYRHVQRLLSTWLESGRIASGDHSAFAVRTAIGALDLVEYDRLSRWLAWICVAARSRGDSTLAARLKQLDTTLGSAVRMAMHKLPGMVVPGHLQRLSA